MAKGKSLKKQQKQQGGEGAAENAIKVFGNTNDQRPVSDKDNTIAMNSPTAAPAMKGGNLLGALFGSDESSTTTAPTVVGGKQSKQQLQKTIKKQLKQLKKKGGASLGFSEYSSAPAASAGAPAEQATAEMTKVVVNDARQTGGQQQQSLDLEKGFMKAGSKMSKQQLQSLSQELDKLQKQQQQGGVGLNEIVVPLVLLYASQKYAQGKTAKKNAKPMSKTMRKARRFSK